MSDDTVYPGLAWVVPYDGRPTDYPTYIALAIPQNREGVERTAWEAIEYGRDATAGMDGDYEAARRHGLAGSGHRPRAGLALVCVDTSQVLTDDSGTPTDGVMATVLAVDGEWMLWRDAHRWGLKGRTQLQDAVESVVVGLVESRSKKDHKAITSDPFDGPTTQAEKQRHAAELEKAVDRIVSADPERFAADIWKCDDCGAINAPALTECIGCGLKRPGPEPTTNITEAPMVPYECIPCSSVTDATKPIPCPRCGREMSMCNLEG